MSPLLADFIHARGCKPICAKLLTLPMRKKRTKKEAGASPSAQTEGGAPAAILKIFTQSSGS